MIEFYERDWDLGKNFLLFSLQSPMTKTVRWAGDSEEEEAGNNLGGHKMCIQLSPALLVTRGHKNEKNFWKSLEERPTFETLQIPRPD